MDKTTFIKINSNKVIDEKCIEWVKELHNCMIVCAEPHQCPDNKDTQILCKFYGDNKSYERLKKYIL